MFFATHEKILELEFVKKNELVEIFRYDVPMQRQPKRFVLNQDQTIYCVTSPEDAYYYNRETKRFVNLSELYSITQCKDCIYDDDDGAFFIFVNMYK